MLRFKSPRVKNPRRDESLSCASERRRGCCERYVPLFGESGETERQGIRISDGTLMQASPGIGSRQTRFSVVLLKSL